MVVPGESGPVFLNAGGVFVVEGDGFRRISAEGITQLHPVAGEVWGTCSSGCGVRRLLPVADRAITRSTGLLDERVAEIVSPAPGVLCISYAPSLDLGISVISGTVWMHYSPGNSPLVAGRVQELSVDGRGGAWVRYGGERLGVSRIVEGKVVNYTTANSALPYDTVDLVAPEPVDRGIPGDLVWLVTVDGLTRFDPAKAEWKHYGRKHGDATDFLRMSGLDSLFGDAITGINRIAFSRGEAWFTTPRQLFRFDGNTFRLVPCAYTDRMEKLRFSSVEAQGDTVWVVLENIDSRKQEAVAAWTAGNGWRKYNPADYGLRSPEQIDMYPMVDKIIFVAPEWGNIMLSFGLNDDKPIVTPITLRNDGK